MGITVATVYSKPDRFEDCQTKLLAPSWPGTTHIAAAMRALTRRGSYCLCSNPNRVGQRWTKLLVPF